jgi:Ca-activated chloride channel family protein
MITDFRFLHPWVLVLLALVPFVIWLQYRARKQGTPALLFSDGTLAAGIRPTWRQRVDSILPFVRGLVLVLGIFALARPQHGTVERSVRTLGVDIALAIDVSGSMQALDLTPNRLEAAKEAAIQFIKARAADRLSIALFGKSGAILCPPTFDRDTAEQFVQSIDNGIINGDMTAVGTGLGLAVDMLKDSEARSRVVVLLTDGVNNSGQISPIQAAEAAKALGVKVYTIGVGGEGPAIIPRVTPRGVVGYQQIAADVDERTLRQISEMTGGQYFRARDTDGLKQIYSEIDSLERTELEVDETADYEERFFLLWFPALMLLGADVLLRAFVLRRLP